MNNIIELDHHLLSLFLVCVCVIIIIVLAIEHEPYDRSHGVIYIRQPFCSW